MKKLLTLLTLLPMLAFAKPKTIELNKNNSISFNQSFSGMYVAEKQLELMNLLATSPEKDIYLVLYTPGGSISAGQLFIDTANALSNNIHTITIFSASMGYQTVQGLGRRYILPSGTLMSHRGYASGLSGQIPGELNTRVEMLEATVEQMEIRSADRVGISLKEYKEAIRDELWLVGQDAVDAGHADEVVLAKCDSSLSGTYSKKINTFFGPVQLEFANCPLITAPVSVDFGNREAVDHVMKYYNNITGLVNVR